MIAGRKLGLGVSEGETRGGRRQFIRGAALAAAGGLLAARPAEAQRARRGRSLLLEQGGTLAVPGATIIWSIQPRDRNKAPFQTSIGGFTFNGQFDTVMYGPGYNQANHGRRIMPQEPSFGPALEQHYFDDSGNRYIEWYLEAGHSSFEGSSPPLGPTRRPIFLQFNRITGELPQFELRANTFTFTGWASGEPYATLDHTGMTLGGAAQTGQTVALMAPAGQGSAFNMQHDGRAGLEISTHGAANIAFSVLGRRTLSLFDRRAAIGVEDNGAALTLLDAFGGDVCVAREGPDGQTGQFFVARNHEGTTRHWRVGPHGHMFIARTAPPPDSEIEPGECGLWFDPTAGAPKLMLKARQADGAVKTAEVPLT